MKYIVRIFSTTLPFALLGVVMFHLACRTGASLRKAFLMVIAYGFGTIALIHSTLFSGHQITASFAFFSFALVFQQSEEEIKKHGHVQSVRLFLAGLFAGLAAITDFPAIIVAFYITIYVFLSGQSLRNLLLFILGGLICAALVGAYNIKCFGNPLSLSYSHLSLEKFREETAIGLFGIHFPSFKIMANLLFSPSRGLFIIMPILLLAFPGLGTMLLDKSIRRETFLIVAICITYLIFNSGYCGWHGGWTFGPRYLVPMLPFMVFFIAFGKWDSFSFLILFLLSAFQVTTAVVGMPHTPEDVRNPLIEIIIPCMGQGYLAQNVGILFKIPGILSFVPIIIVVVFMIVIAFRKVSVVNENESESKSIFFRFAVCLLLLVVIAMLAFTKTKSDKIIHTYRWRLLCHAGWVLHSPELIKASEREAVLARDSLK
jgi:hypothetical protein